MVVGGYQWTTERKKHLKWSEKGSKGDLSKNKKRDKGEAIIEKWEIEFLTREDVQDKERQFHEIERV